MYEAHNFCASMAGSDKLPASSPPPPAWVITWMADSLSAKIKPSWGLCLAEHGKILNIKTSWANARVKLHSQVHFGFWIKIWYPKFLTSFVLKNIVSNKKRSKNYQSEEALGPKRCWVPKDFGSKKILGQKNVGSKKFLVPKTLSQKKNLVKKCLIKKKRIQKQFGSKNFFVQTNIW